MKGLVKASVFALLLLSMRVMAMMPTLWQPLAPGVAYAALSAYTEFSIGTIYAFRVDLQHYALTLAFAKDQQQPAANVNELTAVHNAIIGVNGGFFTPDLNPLGLRIHNGAQRMPIRPVSWWGIFMVKDNVPKIVSQRDYQPDSAIEFAVQSGPRLLVDGQIPALKPGFASRTALCITAKKEVVVLATENLRLTTTELAEIIRRPSMDGGLDCVDALNLDGGRSTQLYAKVGKFQLYVPGYSQVADAVLVIPKKA